MENAFHKPKKRASDGFTSTTDNNVSKTLESDKHENEESDIELFVPVNEPFGQSSEIDIQDNFAMRKENLIIFAESGELSDLSEHMLTDRNLPITDTMLS